MTAVEDTITSRDNARYQRLKRLAEDKQARRDTGLTLIDGEHLIEMAVAAGMRLPVLVCSASAGASALGTWRDAHPFTEVLTLSDSLFKVLSPVQTPTGIMAVAEVPRPEAALVDFAILLEDIQDPGNLGAVLRCAAAAGVGAAYLSKGCAEAWSPKALRGGQGAQFLLAIHEQVDLPAVAGQYADACYAAVLGSSASLYGLRFSGPCAFAFGNEGAGLSASLVSRCRPFSIPMQGPLESLNVATAAAVCLFERVRQGREGPRRS